MRGVTKQTKLPSVAAAPFAQQKMQSQAKTFRKGKLLVERKRLEPCRVAATGRDRAQPIFQGGAETVQRLHVKLHALFALTASMVCRTNIPILTMKPQSGSSFVAAGRVSE